MKTNGQTVSARFTTSDASLLKQVCTARGEDVSDFIRRSVRKELACLGFYDNEVRLALGVDQYDRSERE